METVVAVHVGTHVPTDVVTNVDLNVEIVALMAVEKNAKAHAVKHVEVAVMAHVTLVAWYARHGVPTHVMESASLHVHMIAIRDAEINVWVVVDTVVVLMYVNLVQMGALPQMDVGIAMQTVLPQMLSTNLVRAIQHAPRLVMLAEVEYRAQIVIRHVHRHVRMDVVGILLGRVLTHVMVIVPTIVQIIARVNAQKLAEVHVPEDARGVSPVRTVVKERVIQRATQDATQVVKTTVAIHVEMVVPTHAKDAQNHVQDVEVSALENAMEVARRHAQQVAVDRVQLVVVIHASVYARINAEIPVRQDARLSA